jgi:hypothetical protein
MLGHGHFGGAAPPPHQNVLIDMATAIIIALPEVHPLAQQKQLSLKTLAAEPFILHPRY